jgi:hypothetical protein
MNFPVNLLTLISNQITKKLYRKNQLKMQQEVVHMITCPPLPTDGFTPYLDNAEEIEPDTDEAIDYAPENDESSFWDNMVFPI